MDCISNSVLYFPKKKTTCIKKFGAASSYGASKKNYLWSAKPNHPDIVMIYVCAIANLVMSVILFRSIISQHLTANQFDRSFPENNLHH
jgi:hypothetical protein